MRKTKGGGGGKGAERLPGQGLGSEALPPPRAPRPGPAGPPCGAWLGCAVAHRRAPHPGVRPRPSGGPALRIAGLSLTSLASVARTWALSITAESEGGECGRQRASLRGGWDSPPPVCLQLHNTGLGFCADCAAKEAAPGCAVMLAPCRDGEPQQVGGQRSQTPRASLPGCPSLPLGASPFPVRVLVCAWGPTLVTRPPTCPEPLAQMWSLQRTSL